MKIINKLIWILLLVFLVIQNVCCQDEYNIQKNIHLEKITSNNGKIEAIPSYSNNVMPSHFNSPPINFVQFQAVDDSNKIPDYNSFDRGRTRKIFRIKNPFQQSSEEDTSEKNISKDLHDNETGASNQYGAIQYSLPPEEFLQQMKADNPYHLQQATTPSPIFGYTATPQSPYQYSTITTPIYNIRDHQNNLTLQMESKRFSQVSNPKFDNLQYNNAYVFGIDAIQSTPSSVTLYLSTSSPNNQYISTPTNNYVSSSSPIYLSSPANLQSYYTSTLSNIQTGSPGYNNINRYSTANENNAFNYVSNNKDNDPSIRVNHYDNSANGVKFTLNEQQPYQNEFPSSTQLPVSSTYSNTNGGTWQSVLHLSRNRNPYSRQEAQTPQTFPNYLQESQKISNLDNAGSDTHRVGSMPSENNLFLSFSQPDYQTFNELKNRERDLEPQYKQDVYSHGDYGWKLDGRKPLVNYDVKLPTNYPKQQVNNYHVDGSPLSSSYRYIDNKQTYDYDRAAKYNSEKIEAYDFAKAAAKSLENMKKQQEMFLNNYSTNARFSGNELSNTELNNILRNNNNQKSLAYDNSNAYSQIDIITASPYYYPYSKENIFDHTAQQTFDEDKLLQNMKIDVSNANSINEAHKNMQSDTSKQDISSQYNKKEQIFKQMLKPLSEAYYKDKNMVYGYNIKTKAGEVIPSDSSRGLESTDENVKKYDSINNVNNLSYNPQSDITLRPFAYSSQSNVENVPFQSIIQQRLQNPSDGNSLKLNDVPYWLTRGLNNLRHPLPNTFNHGFISTGTPLTLNQHVDSHQIDVATSILNKLIRDKQLEISLKPESNSQRETIQPTKNELKVVYPYNLELKKLPDILKGRLALNDVYSQSFRNPLNPQWDMTQLQRLMLKNDNVGQYGTFNDGMGSISSPFFELHNTGGYPYQGVKYSRSQEEEESLVPITGSNLIHPIGAVIEQDDSENENKDSDENEVMESTSNDLSIENDGEKPKLHSQRMVTDKNRHPFSISDRYYPHRRLPLNSKEPYPLLKPPPIHTMRSRSRSKIDHNRRQRRNKIKLSRIVKREPFEDESSIDDLKPTIPTLLRPPPLAADDKSDFADNEH